MQTIQSFTDLNHTINPCENIIIEAVDSLSALLSSLVVCRWSSWRVWDRIRTVGLSADCMMMSRETRRRRRSTSKQQRIVIEWSKQARFRTCLVFNSLPCFQRIIFTSYYAWYFTGHTSTYARFDRRDNNATVHTINAPLHKSHIDVTSYSDALISQTWLLQLATRWLVEK